MSARGAGKAHNLPGWVWLEVSDEDGLSATIRADSIIYVQPIWDKDRDVCTGCLVHLTSGTVAETSAMPHEVGDAIKDAMGV